MALLIVKNLSPEYQTCDRRFEAATRFPSILLGGSLIPIVVCGEAVCGEAILALFSIRGRDALATLRPAGILPAAENKGRMPSPHGDGFSLAKHVPAKRHSFGCNSFMPGEFLLSFSRLS